MSKVNTNNDPKPMQKIKLDPPKQAEYTLSPLSLSLGKLPYDSNFSALLSADLA